MFQDKLTKEIAAAAAKIKTEPPKDEVNTKSVEGAVMSIMANEELKGNQHKIDANKNGKIDAHDFKLLRAKKGVKEDVEQLDEVGDTKAGRKALSSYVQKALQDKGREKGLRKATSRLYKDNYYGKKTNEETENVEEGWKGAGIGGAIGSAVAGPIGAAVGGALGHATGEALHSLKKRTGAAVHAFKQKPRQEEVELGEEDAYSKDRYAVKDGKATKDNPSHMGSPNYKDQPHHVWAKSPEHALQKKMKKEEVEQLDELFGKGKLPAIADYHKQKGAEAKGKMEKIRNTNTTLPVPKEKSAKIYAKDAEAKYHSTQAKRANTLMKKEEIEMNEGFPTVADAAKRMASKESNFEKKKISTGTVYSRKYKAEPEENDEVPKKKAKTMKEMLEIYSKGGSEALVKNLMIEEPSQDEYKKEVETAQAKADGKIRNDKGVAKPASQGVKMEEVEIEVIDADEINGVQIDNIEERSLTDAEMNKREEIVKSMKKGIQGFKDRYGERAKEVMYATATARAKKD